MAGHGLRVVFQNMRQQPSFVLADRYLHVATSNASVSVRMAASGTFQGILGAAATTATACTCIHRPLEEPGLQPAPRRVMARRPGQMPDYPSPFRSFSFCQSPQVHIQLQVNSCIQRRLAPSLEPERTQNLATHCDYSGHQHVEQNRRTSSYFAQGFMQQR